MAISIGSVSVHQLSSLQSSTARGKGLSKNSGPLTKNSVRVRAPRSELYGDAALGLQNYVSISRPSGGAVRAVADHRENALLDVERSPADKKVVDYNWEEQWYPLYLTREIPKDAPLALTVYDRNLVVFYDGDGKINCLEDRCPHRAAKLSEGQLMDGRLECLYHGWQFEGNGNCAKIPQLAPGAKIPRQACARSYALKDTQGVLWVWMADASKAPYEQVPYFEAYDREGWMDYSAIHELPYDHSVLLENLMDPAHIPISHDRTDTSAKRELAQAMVFDVTERTDRGFAGFWHNITTPEIKNFTRFQSPCVASNETARVLEDGSTKYLHATILSRPAGQGKAMLIIRFSGSGGKKKGINVFSLLPPWLIHKTANTIFEQDMGFLSSQNELLIREAKPTKDIYLNLRSQDVWVEEYRKWLDKVGHGMPHYYGHRTMSPAPKSALEEASPAGLTASIASTYPSKGSFGHMYARDPTNRYFRHIIHCKACRRALSRFEKNQKLSLVLAAVSAGVAIVLSKPQWRAACVAIAFLMCAVAWACSRGIATMTENWVRPHRKTL